MYSTQKHCSIGEPDLAYRPALDGLRAFAVVSVYLYHLDASFLPGGFLGVDVFFVISGFLITRIILKELGLGTFTFSVFYQRRVARIFPAYFLVAVTSIVAAYFLYSRQDYASAGANLFAATLCLANMKYIMQGDYFLLVHDSQPYLHYWSLAVEKQFYVFYPVLLFIINRPQLRIGLSIVVSMILLVVTFLACLWVTPLYNEIAFYSLPTRAWELMAGCVMALYALQRGQQVSTSSCLPAVGLMLVVCSFIFIEQGPDLPGYKAAFPVLGAVLLIGHVWNQRHWVESFLSWSCFVKVGKISYSLYLWHWPVFCFVDYHYYTADEPFRIAIKLFLSIALSVLTYQLIEKRSRRAINTLQKPSRLFAGMFVFACVLLFAGYQVRNYNYVDSDLKSIEQGGRLFGSLSNDCVVLFGDSTAAMYGKLFSELPNEHAIRTVILAGPGQDVLPVLTPGQAPNLYWQGALSAIKEHQPKVVFYAIALTSKSEAYKAQLRFALKQLSELQSKSMRPMRIVLISEIPFLEVSDIRNYIRKVGPQEMREAADKRSRREATLVFLQSFTNHQISVIDTSELFVSQEGGLIIADENDRLFYHDSHHLTHLGSLRVKDAIVREIENTLH